MESGKSHRKRVLAAILERITAIIKRCDPDNFLTIVCADRGLYADWGSGVQVVIFAVRLLTVKGVYL